MQAILVTHFRYAKKHGRLFLKHFWLMFWESVKCIYIRIKGTFVLMKMRAKIEVEKQEEKRLFEELNQLSPKLRSQRLKEIARQNLEESVLSYDRERAEYKQIVGVAKSIRDDRQKLTFSGV